MCTCCVTAGSERSVSVSMRANRHTQQSEAESPQTGNGVRLNVQVLNGVQCRYSVSEVAVQLTVDKDAEPGTVCKYYNMKLTSLLELEAQLAILWILLTID